MNKRRNLISFRTLHREWMEDPEFRREYEVLEPEFQIAKQMIGARLQRKMSQEDLAKKAKTGQAVISRLEGMNAQPSLALLKRVAQALDIKLRLTIS
ncbi:MAG: helix-turn-helix transcriptional regulator [bacterium]|nr:helix-turn-helix transcriptional regulator [bacterium]